MKPETLAGLRFLLLASAVLLGGAAPAATDADVTEPGTGAHFPARVQFRHGSTDFALSATGTGVRRIFLVRVYAMAHYLEDRAHPSTAAALLEQTLSDTYAKQITLVFTRDLAAEQLRSALEENYRDRASHAEMAETEDLLRQFLAAIDRDVKQGDRFTVRWLPGGVLLSIFDEVPVLELHSAKFARVFWSIWFGPRPVMDNRSLIELRLSSGPSSSVPPARGPHFAQR